MRMREGLIRWTVRLAFLALVVGVVLSFRQSLDSVAVSTVKSAGKPPRGEDELCADLVLEQRAGGGDHVSVGRIFTRRVRRGPFSFAVREMVIDRLALTLPESYFRPPESEAVPAPEAAGPTTPSVLDVMKDEDRLKKMFPRVAKLCVDGLAIDRLEGGTNAVPWLRAAKGSVENGGLALHAGFSVENGVTNAWKSAFLALKPCLRLYR